MRRFWAFIFTSCWTVSSASAFELELPLACEVGKTCWVQQYADHDPSKAMADYTCGSIANDKHDGTDIRVLNAKSDVDVLAAAPGSVKALRKTVDDRFANTPELLDRVKNIECGNGVVIAHSGGYETQYCHLKKGSIVVRAGEMVAAGAVLGKVGYSGAASFPHLHFSVRRARAMLDPFSGPVTQDCKSPPQSLWSAKAKALLTYESPSLLEIGWTDKQFGKEDLNEGNVATAQPQRNWPALVGYARFINLKKGDSVTLEVFGPAGQISGSTQVMDNSKAVQYLYAGRKAPTDWPVGQYSVKVLVQRDGKIVMERAIEATLQ